MSRRLRLIWHKLWLIPLVGATADVVASEAAKLAGVTVPIPWPFSAIGVAGMLGAAVVRAYSVPLIPEGLETPDEALTRRSRILGERLGATPVRVFVSDLPKLRGKVDTFLDGHDLFVSTRVAALPEAERDFVLARALATLSTSESLARAVLATTTILVACAIYLLSLISAPPRAEWLKGEISIWQVRESGLNFHILLLFVLVWCRVRRSRYALDGSSWNQIALGATNDLGAAQRALIATRDSQLPKAIREADLLEAWWNTNGQKAVEASEWYRRERGLAAKAE